MPDEATVTSINETKTASDGSVKISVEKYEELLKTITDQKDSISNLNVKLSRALNEPPVINRTTVIKTADMIAQEQRVWGGTFMGLGAAMFMVGAGLYKAGRS